jgi:restriction endonuclease S subunit
LSQLKIPVPSLARQKEIVAYCEHNDSLIKQLENEIELNKTQARQFLKGIVKTQEQDDEPENIIPVYEMDHNEMADEEDDTDDAYEKLMEEYKKNEEEQDYSQNIVASLI